MKLVIFWAMVAGMAGRVAADAWYQAQIAAARGGQDATAHVAATSAPLAPAKPIGGGYDWQPLDGESRAQRQVPRLHMTPSDAHRQYQPPPARYTTSVWRVMGTGLARGLANTTMWPGELARGVTYESTAQEWYVAPGTAFLTGMGGGINRLCAGLGDLVTCGYFGDVQLAQGYPEYVWDGDWVYEPRPPTVVRDTSGSAPRLLAEEDVKQPTPAPRPTPRPTYVTNSVARTGARR